MINCLPKTKFRTVIGGVNNLFGLKKYSERLKLGPAKIHVGPSKFVGII